LYEKPGLGMFEQLEVSHIYTHIYYISRES